MAKEKSRSLRDDKQKEGDGKEKANGNQSVAS
jgi:hypothetical protein